MMISPKIQNGYEPAEENVPEWQTESPAGQTPSDTPVNGLEKQVSTVEMDRKGQFYDHARAQGSLEGRQVQWPEASAED